MHLNFIIIHIICQNWVNIKIKCSFNMLFVKILEQIIIYKQFNILTFLCPTLSILSFWICLVKFLGVLSYPSLHVLQVCFIFIFSFIFIQVPQTQIPASFMLFMLFSLCMGYYCININLSPSYRCKTWTTFWCFHWTIFSRETWKVWKVTSRSHSTRPGKTTKQNCEALAFVLNLVRI